ncbi:MAG: hypothetical protein LLF94_05750 [Chlamydiales bacterium]|nr:hypothetical protein [Chlamydiales bacterium]
MLDGIKAKLNLYVQENPISGRIVLGIGSVAFAGAASLVVSKMFNLDRLYVIVNVAQTAISTATEAAITAVGTYCNCKTHNISFVKAAAFTAVTVIGLEFLVRRNVLGPLGYALHMGLAANQIFTMLKAGRDAYQQEQLRARLLG